METEEEKDMSIVRRVVEVNLNCDSCEFSTFWSRRIDNHHNMVHTAGDKQLYECEHCKFSTRYRHSLRRHVKKKHFVIDTVMKIADNEILEFLSQNIISTPQPCNQSSDSSIRDTINYTGTADNTENERSSSYINNNFLNGISSSAVTSSNNYQDEVSSSGLSTNCQTGASNIFDKNNCENVISSSIALNNYQGGSFFVNNINNFQNGINSSYINSNIINGISSSVGNTNFQSEIGSNFVRNSCKSVISSSIASNNNYQRPSSSFFINNVNGFQNGISSSFINNNNCINDVTSSTFSKSFQNGSSSISVPSNYENVISSNAVSSNYQNTRRNSGGFVSNMSTNYFENFDETLSTESHSRPKPPSLGNELNPGNGNNIIVFVCELCGFECSSADLCYNHAAEHQTIMY